MVYSLKCKKIIYLFLPFFNFSVSVEHQAPECEKNNSANRPRPNIYHCFGIAVHFCKFEERRKENFHYGTACGSLVLEENNNDI